MVVEFVYWLKEEIYMDINNDIDNSDQKNDKENQKEKSDRENIVRNTIIMYIVSLIIFNFLCIKGFTFPWIDTESQWIGFFGSFLNSITTIVALYWTISYTREQSQKERDFAMKQAEEERRLTIMPYINVTTNAEKEKITTSDIYSYVLDDITNELQNVTKALSIKNIGNGPVIWLKVSDFRFTTNNNQYIENKNTIRSSTYQMIEKNNCILLIIKIEFFMQERIKTTSDYEVSKWLKNGSLIFKITYKDIRGNLYEQEVNLTLSISYTVDEDDYYKCVERYISLSEVSEPRLIGREEHVNR